MQDDIAKVMQAVQDGADFEFRDLAYVRGEWRHQPRKDILQDQEAYFRSLCAKVVLHNEIRVYTEKLPEGYPTPLREMPTETIQVYIPDLGEEGGYYSTWTHSLAAKFALKRGVLFLNSADAREAAKFLHPLK